MIELQGVKNKDCKIFTDNVEESALSTIYNIINEDAFENVPIRIMPDVHDGKDIVIGFTAPLTGKVNPNHIGVDIGCGVLCVTYEVQHNIPLEDVDNLIRDVIPLGYCRNSKGGNMPPELTEEVEAICKKLSLDFGDVTRQLGTLGGGNHFIELGTTEGMGVITIHTGSRNFGKRVCDYHANKAKIKGTKYLEGTDMEEYIHDMKIAQHFASLNRSLILLSIFKVLNISTMDIIHNIDTIHNYIDNNNIIRKGAVSAQENELLVIPMNMRDGILVCKGKGNPDWNYSAPHGAGRIYSRSKAKEQLSLEEFKREMEGIYSTSVNQSTIDESPMAYKPIDEITKHIKDTVEILYIIKPDLNIKA